MFHATAAWQTVRRSADPAVCIVSALSALHGGQDQIAAFFASRTTREKILDVRII